MSMKSASHDTTSSHTTYPVHNKQRSDETGVIAVGTVSTDTIQTLLENGWIDGAVRDYQIIEEDKNDTVNHVSGGPVGEAYIRAQLTSTDPTMCEIKSHTDGRQIVHLHWHGQQTIRFSVDIRHVEFEFDFNSSDEDAEQTTPSQSSGDVYETLQTGDEILWDGKQQPLTVVLGYEDSANEHELPGEPKIKVEGPRGGKKTLRRDDIQSDIVTVASVSMSGGPQKISNLRKVDPSD